MKTLKYILLSCLICFSLWGCQEPHSENHLNAAVIWIGSTLSPVNEYDSWLLSQIGVGETLFKLDEQGNIVPWLADTYEQIDQTTWKFHIRYDVSFSNGSTLDAKSVKDCLERTFAKNPKAREYIDLAEIKVSGAYVILYLNTPSSVLLNSLCEPLFTIYDASEPEETLLLSPSCTGPFKIASFIPNSSVDCLKNEFYWGGEVQLETIHLTQITDSADRIAALQNGKADLAANIDYMHLSLFNDPEEYRVYESLSSRCQIIYFNHESPFLQDLTIRQALSYAVDRTKTAKIIGGKEADELFFMELMRDLSVKNPYSYSISEANRLLDEAGYIDSNQDGIREMNGAEIELVYASKSHDFIAQSFQREAAEIGVAVKIKSTDNLTDESFDMYSANDFMALTGDSENFLRLHYYTGAFDNLSHYSNSEVDALIDALSSTFDLEARQKIESQIFEMLLDDAASLYISYSPLNTVVRADVKGGRQFLADCYMITKDICIGHGCAK